jgi:hypothetical protein
MSSVLTAVSHLVRQAVTDQRLEPVDVRVLVVATDVLDFIEFRPLKPAGLAAMAHMNPSRVAVALRRLVAAGYLVAAPLEPANQRTFRIPFSKGGAPNSSPATNGREA